MIINQFILPIPTKIPRLQIFKIAFEWIISFFKLYLIIHIMITLVIVLLLIHFDRISFIIIIITVNSLYIEVEGACILCSI